MNTAWTKGIRKGSQEDKDIRSSYTESFIIRKRLTQMLDDKIDGKMKTAMSNDAFDSPSWAFLQAESIGYAKAMQEIIKLLDTEKKKD